MRRCDRFSTLVRRHSSYVKAPLTVKRSPRFLDLAESTDNS